LVQFLLIPAWTEDADGAKKKTPGAAFSAHRPGRSSRIWFRRLSLLRDAPGEGPRKGQAKKQSGQRDAEHSEEILGATKYLSQGEVEGRARPRSSFGASSDEDAPSQNVVITVDLFKEIWITPRKISGDFEDLFSKPWVHLDLRQLFAMVGSSLE
jgi:hypothetical protein